MDLSKDYYIGLDCGTESVGFAVTDTDYKVLKFHGKSMWGSHLFEEANTAAARRTNRAARRRYLRKKERIDLLQGLFDEEISKIDPTFFLRLNDSAYHLEHKHIKQKNSLFNDSNYTDKDFYKEFPTIFHLRKALYEGKTKADPRLLYLALHHILKNRGHFLLPGTGMKSVTSPTALVQAIKNSTSTVFEDFEFEVESEKALEEAIKIRKSKDRIEALSKIIETSDEKIKKMLVKALVGYTVKPAELFDNEVYKELPSIQFSKNMFEETDLPTLEDALDDDQYLLVVNLKGLYDWGLLINILSGKSTIAEAKVDLWNKNKEQLALLKKVLKNHTNKKDYEDFFHQDSEGSF